MRPHVGNRRETEAERNEQALRPATSHGARYRDVQPWSEPQAPQRLWLKTPPSSRECQPQTAMGDCPVVRSGMADVDDAYPSPPCASWS
jgi:hypothetical protein